MRMNRFMVAVLCAGALMVGTVQAQVWKCTNNETGRIEYSGTPCSGRNSTGDRLNARSRASESSASRSQAQRQDERGQAESAPRQEGGAQGNGSGDNSECAAADNAYESAKAQRAAASVTQPLRDRANALCGRAPTGAGRATPSRVSAGISSCDGSGCWDTDGNRYNAGGGNTYFSADGQTCRKVGAQLQCG